MAENLCNLYPLEAKATLDGLALGERQRCTHSRTRVDVLRQGNRRFAECVCTNVQCNHRLWIKDLAKPAYYGQLRNAPHTSQEVEECLI